MAQEGELEGLVRKAMRNEPSDARTNAIMFAAMNPDSQRRVILDWRAHPELYIDFTNAYPLCKDKGAVLDMWGEGLLEKRDSSSEDNNPPFEFPLVDFYDFLVKEADRYGLYKGKWSMSSIMFERPGYAPAVRGDSKKGESYHMGHIKRLDFDLCDINSRSRTEALRIELEMPNYNFRGDMFTLEKGYRRSIAHPSNPVNSIDWVIPPSFYKLPLVTFSKFQIYNSLKGVFESCKPEEEQK